MICPITKEKGYDQDYCESTCMGEGCSKIKDCEAYKRGEKNGRNYSKAD